MQHADEIHLVYEFSYTVCDFSAYTSHHELKNGNMGSKPYGQMCKGAQAF